MAAIDIRRGRTITVRDSRLNNIPRTFIVKQSKLVVTRLQPLTHSITLITVSGFLEERDQVIFVIHSRDMFGFGIPFILPLWVQPSVKITGWLVTHNSTITNLALRYMYMQLTSHLSSIMALDGFWSGATIIAHAEKDKRTHYQDRPDSKITLYAANWNWHKSYLRHSLQQNWPLSNMDRLEMYTVHHRRDYKLNWMLVRTTATW